MCTGESFASAADAVRAASAALSYLATVDAASLPAVTQAECLRGLGRVEAAHTAAHARLLAAFDAGGGYEHDGQGSARTWLRWQARITRGAAAGAMGWRRRLVAHPEVAAALAGGGLSPSWAREICRWSDLLPEGHRPAADGILLQAAAAGADLADLAGLAGEIRRRTAVPDRDGGNGPAERNVRLDVTFGGVGKLLGDLTPACTAAFTAVLEALGAKAGPEDTRTAGQRHHDALEEACRRLAASGFVPDRAGQPTHIQLHLTLGQLRSLDGAAGTEAAWAAGQAAGDGQPGWLTGRAAAAYACDAAITPVVTGHLDPAALDTLTAAFQAAAAGLYHRRVPGCNGAPARSGPSGPAASPLPPATRARLAGPLLRYAADVLSGPTGLAAFLRTHLLGAEFPAVSLPLDTGSPAPTIPGHLRRAVATRDRHCAFPGCHQKPAACHVHHLRPRADGGPTRLDNLILLCAFHHLIAVHGWGWTLTLHATGTVTATSPDGTRTLHSHGPPNATPA